MITLQEKGLKLAIISFLAMILGISCLEFPHQYKHLAPGKWRATLKLDQANSTPMTKPLDEHSLSEIRNIEIESVTSGELPFILDVKYVNEDSFYIELINGKETIILDDIQFGRSYKLAKDTIEIYFTEYNSMIKAVVEDRIMEGLYFDFNRDNYSIPFVAMQAKDYRFTKLRKKPLIDLSGKWTTTFGLDTDELWYGEAQFEQDGNNLEATFATETGDFRYLSGTIQGNKLYLSTFDGSHAFLFEGKIGANDSIEGVFLSGKHYSTYWEAAPGELKLKNPFEILEVDETIKLNIPEFLLENFNIRDSRIQAGVPTIIEIMGTWCPNCKDASLFLEEMGIKYPKIQKIALAFEKKNLKNLTEHLEKYSEKLGLTYPVIYAGIADKQTASEKLGFVSNIYSYPSFFFINADGKILASYSGFYGPATEQNMDQLQQLEKIIESML